MDTLKRLRSTLLRCIYASGYICYILLNLRRFSAMSRGQQIVVLALMNLSSILGVSIFETKPQFDLALGKDPY